MTASPASYLLEALVQGALRRVGVALVASLVQRMGSPLAEVRSRMRQHLIGSEH